MKLKNIADIIPGYAFRGAIVPEKDGTIRVIQAKDIKQGVPITDLDNITRTSLYTKNYTGYVRKGDILIITRGMKAGAFRSTVFAVDSENVIASSSVYVIRITDKKILPEYLSHYLNSKDGQDTLSQIVSGSFVGALPRKQLEAINIAIPTPEKQKVIIDLYSNVNEQRKILDRKNELHQKIINAAFAYLTV